MSVAVGALRMEVRPPFIVLAAIAGIYAVVGLNLIFNETVREGAKPPASPLERSKKAARAKLPPLPTRNETRRATPPPRTETVKIRPAGPNAKIDALPKSSIAKIEPVKPDAKISALSKKSKAAKAAAKKHAARQRAMRAALPPLPPRNDRRFAAASPPSKPGAATAESIPPLPLRNEKRGAESKAAAIEPDAQFVAKNAKPQTGKASWYDFHGQTTANGETMDRDELTAAHKTLPLGSKAVVENLDNGQEVEVRINDRGPFVGGRIIDLSKEAAEQIDMLGDGVAKVIVKPAGGVASGGKAKR